MPHIPLPEDLSQYYPPIYIWVFQVVYFPQVFPTKTLYKPLFFTIRVTCPVHLILLYLMTGTIFGEHCTSYLDHNRGKILYENRPP